MGLRNFYGVRYASLAQGKRFDLPVLAGSSERESNDSPYLRTEDVPIFPQLPSRLSTHMGTPVGSYPQQEDAFFLNIFTYSGARSAPVMLFIHGGAWVSGAGTWSWYNGEKLASHGIVVVTVNYRVHAAGLLDDGDIHLPLEDLKTAINWLHHNVQKYGGCPESVTVVGQSAGGWYAHLLSQDASLRGKIRKVALLSMGTRPPWGKTERQEILEQVTLKFSSTSLRDVPIEQLMQCAATTVAAQATRNEGPLELGYAPSSLLPTAASNLSTDFLVPEIAARQLIVSEVFFRYTRHETGIFFANSAEERHATHSDADRVYDSYITLEDEEIIPKHLHTAMISRALDPYQRIVAISSWNQFQRLPHQLAFEYVKAGHAVELREFDFESLQEELGACHCFDLPFQFGQRSNWKDSSFLNGISDKLFDYVSARTMNELVRFVKS